MSDYRFRDDGSPPRSESSGSDPLAAYYHRRLELRQQSINSSRDSSIGILSLNRLSIMDPTSNTKTPVSNLNANETIKKIEDKISMYESLPPVSDRLSVERAKIEQLLKAEESSTFQKTFTSEQMQTQNNDVSSFQNVLFSPHIEPQTPRYFEDVLSSLVTDASSSQISEALDSLVEFPVRNQEEAIKLFENDKSFLDKNAKNISDFSLNKSREGSCLNSGSKLSIGQFFQRRSDSISFFNSGGGKSSSEVPKVTDPANEEATLVPEKNEDEVRKSTMSNIHALLREPGLSATGICEKLLEEKNWPDNTICAPLSTLNSSRHSTPLSSQDRRLKKSLDASATPIRRGNEWQKGRHVVNASTPKVNSDTKDESSWQPVRQSFSGKRNTSDAERTICANPSINRTSATTDLKVPSNRVEEKQEDNSNLAQKSSSSNSPLMSVIKKLADLPSGTVDCSALAPLLNTEYPELLLSSQSGNNLSYRSSSPAPKRSNNPVNSDTGSWVIMETTPIKVSASVRTTKTVSVPLSSRQHWLLLRLSAVELSFGGSSLRATLNGDTFSVPDVISIRAKDVVLPPETTHSLNIMITSFASLNTDLKLTLIVVDLLSSDRQQCTTSISIASTPPSHEFSFSAPLDFGVLPENCFMDRSLELTYNGECDVPIRICLTQGNSQSNTFSLCEKLFLNGEDSSESLTWTDTTLEMILRGGGRQRLELFVRFHPQNIENLKAKKIIKIEESVRVELRVMSSSPVVMAQTSVQGSVAFAKFRCRADCSPMVFHADRTGQIVTKPFILKNVGVIPLEVSLFVTTDLSQTVMQTDSPFHVPKKIKIPLNEEISFDITFNGRCLDGFAKCYLVMLMEPNGQSKFDVQLIGNVSGSSQCSGLSSRSSVLSGPADNGDTNDSSVPKLRASTDSLSWPAIPLQQASIQTFQVKLKGSMSATARIFFKNCSDSFKIMNEKGDALSKVRKTLKPDVPTTITVRFKPSAINLHVDELNFDFGVSSKASKISLTGYGGCPKLRVEDTQSDFYGYKMVKLMPQLTDSTLFTAQFRVTNYGVVRGFVFIQPTSHVLSVGHILKIYPQEVVVEGNANVNFTISLHLSRAELCDMLSSQDVRKVATLSILMGDEPGRQRLRRFLQERDGYNNDLITRLTAEYPFETPIYLENSKESKEFPSVFLKSLQPMDVVVVVEKRTAIGDQTVLDLDDSDTTFNTIVNTSVINRLEEKSPNTTFASAESHRSSNKVVNWLKNVE